MRRVWLIVGAGALVAILAAAIVRRSGSNDSFPGPGKAHWLA